MQTAVQVNLHTHFIDRLTKIRERPTPDVGTINQGIKLPWRGPDACIGLAGVNSMKCVEQDGSRLL